MVTLFELIVHGKRKVMQRRPRTKKERPQHHLIPYNSTRKKFKTLYAGKLVLKDMTCFGIYVRESPGMDDKTPVVPKITGCIGSVDLLELLHE